MNAKDVVIADTLERCLISPNVADSNGEPANADAINNLADATRGV